MLTQQGCQGCTKWIYGAVFPLKRISAVFFNAEVFLNLCTAEIAKKQATKSNCMIEQELEPRLHVPQVTVGNLLNQFLFRQTNQI